MIRNLRRHVKIIMFLVLGAFIALIFFQWGASITDSKVSVNKNIIGKVGKKDIKYEEYKRYIDKRLENAKLQGIKVDDNTYFTLLDSAWAELVADKMWEDFIKKEYLTVSSAEVFEIIRRSPPPEFKNMPVFQTNGQFDYQKYLQWLADPRNTVYIERMQESLRKLLLQEKLRIEVVSSLFLTTMDKEDMLEREMYGFKGTYISYPYANVKGINEPTEKEMKEYYKNNQKTLKTPERRRLSFVEFLFKYSKEDTMVAYERATEAYELIKSGIDFDTIWNNYTENRNESKRFEPLLLYHKKVREILDTMKINSITPPLLLGRTYQIVKLVDKKKDRVKTKIIVFYIRPGEETINRTRKQAEDFIKLANKMGFKEAAQKMGYKHVEPPFWTKKDVALPQIYHNEALATYAFKAKQKEILPILKGKAGYYTFMVDTIVKEGVLPFEKLKNIIRNRIIFARKKEKAVSILRKIYTEIKNIKKMEIDKYKENYEGLEIETFDYTNFYTARQKNGTEFAGSLLQIPINSIYGVIEGNKAAYILKVDNKYINDKKEQEIIDQEATKIIREISTKLIEIPEVEDYRDRLLK